MSNRFLQSERGGSVVRGHVVMTKEMTEKAMHLIKQGMTRSQAAVELGIEYRTLARGIKREIDKLEPGYLPEKREKLKKEDIVIGPPIRYTVQSVAEMRKNYHVGQRILLEVPSEQKIEKSKKEIPVIKKFQIHELHPHFATLADRKGNLVSYDYVYLAENSKGAW